MPKQKAAPVPLHSPPDSDPPKARRGAWNKQKVAEAWQRIAAFRAVQEATPKPLLLSNKPPEVSPELAKLDAKFIADVARYR